MSDSNSHLVLSQYISGDLCSKLTKDAQNFLLENSLHRIHNGRDFIPSTSYTYERLINSSTSWYQLNKLINNEEFLEFILSSLNIKNEFILKKCFSSDFLKKDNFLGKIKKISERSQLSHSSLKIITSQIFLRLYLHIKRNLIYTYFLISQKKKAVEVLFDYSLVGGGYKTPIHRDADLRKLVFILFLNDLEEETKGGNHNLYRKEDSGDFSLIESIKPETGTLIIFSNHENAFHGVDQMHSLSQKRHFIYGSFTQLGDWNNFKRNKKRVQWTLYY